MTFPNLWTNTVCSHPAHVAEELDVKCAIGPRRAALRRAKFELNIDKLDLEDLHCGSRILYYADADETFAEFELDYIIFAKKDVGKIQPNPDEVTEVRYVARNEIANFLSERSLLGESITPWFKLLKDRKLDAWWRVLEETNEFPVEANKIERFL